MVVVVVVVPESSVVVTLPFPGFVSGVEAVLSPAGGAALVEVEAGGDGGAGLTGGAGEAGGAGAEAGAGLVVTGAGVTGVIVGGGALLAGRCTGGVTAGLGMTAGGWRLTMVACWGALLRLRETAAKMMSARATRPNRT